MPIHPDGLRAALPEARAIFDLPPEELGGIILERLTRLQGRGDGLATLHQFTEELKHWDDLPRGQWDAGERMLAEAWAWLQNEGLLMPSPGQTNSSGWMEITRKGRSVAISGGFADYRKAAVVPRSLVHPTIAAKAWPNFIRGDFDTAVFQAFKEVEVAVRNAGGFDARMIGVPLMRAAFDKLTGPLIDPTQPEGEREALAHLFAGAIGSYKNPHSHRTVALLDPAEAGEMLFMASHLLRIVEARRPAAT